MYLGYTDDEKVIRKETIGRTRLVRLCYSYKHDKTKDSIHIWRNRAWTSIIKPTSIDSICFISHNVTTEQ